ncbi:MAG: metal ABC transporter substrate-binding protein [Clostridiales Family XIII bacterium]|nr:metal ABC transporter substrate-binding protein [Clostridiales Family XIII bacterium]
MMMNIRQSMMKNRKTVRSLAALATVAMVSLLFAACGSGSDDKDARTEDKTDGKLNVVATIFPEYDFARAVGGDLAEITMLMDPGAGVHNFDPSPSDIMAIEHADVFLYIGGESDEWVDDILESTDTSGTEVVRLMDYVDGVEEELKEGMEPEEEEESAEDEEGEGHDGEEPEYDEHIWVSPKNAIALIGVIADVMGKKDSANADAYQTNAAAYKAELELIDAQFGEIVKSGARKKIVVADRFPFRYFVDQYGLDYAAAFIGCSDQTDAGPKTIAYLIDTVKKESIPYVYHVELSNRNVAGAICEQTGAGMLQLNSGENVTKEDFDAGVTYVDLMKRNAENLKKGLY